jgi:hypothetical protein
MTPKKKKKAGGVKPKTKKAKQITLKDAKQELEKNKKIAGDYALDKGKTAYLLDEAIKKSKKYKGLLTKC